MAIFNSYVCLPEGIPFVHVQKWTRVSCHDRSASSVEAMLQNRQESSHVHPCCFFSGFHLRLPGNLRTDWANRNFLGDRSDIRKSLRLGSVTKKTLASILIIHPDVKTCSYQFQWIYFHWYLYMFKYQYHVHLVQSNNLVKYHWNPIAQSY